MCAERDGIDAWCVRLLMQHAERMARSAAAFGVRFNASEWLRTVEQTLHEQRHVTATRLRVRIGLHMSGALAVSTSVAEDTPKTARFAFHPHIMDSTNPFLQHKTSVRAHYNAALAEARAQGLFDCVFTNELGQVTEGARSSIFIQLNGEWLTPPLSCGVLPGIARAELLADTSFNARECAFSINDVQHAERVMLCNALHRIEVERVDLDFKAMR